MEREEPDFPDWNMMDLVPPPEAEAVVAHKCFTRPKKGFRRDGILCNENPELRYFLRIRLNVYVDKPPN